MTGFELHLETNSKQNTLLYRCCCCCCCFRISHHRFSSKPNGVYLENLLFSSSSSSTKEECVFIYFLSHSWNVAILRNIFVLLLILCVSEDMKQKMMNRCRYFIYIYIKRGLYSTIDPLTIS